MNRHGYFDPDRIFAAGQHPPEPGPECSCCHYWPLETPNSLGLMRKRGDPLVAIQLTENGISGYWSPEPHPRMLPFHQTNQDTLF